MKEKLIMELIDLALENKTKNNISSEYPFKVGSKYFIRTVTHHFTGKVVDIKGSFLVLEDAAWIAEGERHQELIQNGEFKEVEPIKDTVEFGINITSIIDYAEVKWDLPNKQK